jgi:hypothetical protein
MQVVTKAIITSMVKRRGERIPRSEGEIQIMSPEALSHSLGKKGFRVEFVGSGNDHQPLCGPQQRRKQSRHALGSAGVATKRCGSQTALR